MERYFSYFVVAGVLLSAILTSCNKENIENKENSKNKDYTHTVSLDDTFGQNGRIIIPNTSEISLLDIDRDGNIVAVGYTMILGSGGKSYLTLAKINSDELSGNNWLTKVTDYESGWSIGLKIAKDNKIVVIGGFAKVQFQGWETIMMRFNQDGTVDNTYGDNGKVNLNFNAGNIISVNVDSDDFMLLAKIDYQSEDRSPYIVKYNYDGVIDKSFGKNGEVRIANSIVPYCIRILNDGSIVVAGTYNTRPNTELGLCKLTANGELDKEFATNGIWHMNIMQDFTMPSDHESFFNILEDKNGNLVLSGSGLTNDLGWGNRAFLSKFSSNGKLDKSFGKNGFFCFDFGGSNKPIFQIGNNYITAGWLNNESHKIISVNSDGSFGDYIYTSDIYYFMDMKLHGNTLYLGGGYKIDDNHIFANFAVEKVNID